MKDLLYKEFKLSLHPTMFFFLAFGLLLLIPSWPYFIAFGYLFLALMNTFFIGRGDQDIFFTASLPIRKRDVVRARVYSTAVFELLMILAAIPFAVLYAGIYPQGNLAGMNPNFAFFGFVFMMYAIFNAVFFPVFYKTAYEVGKSVFLGVLVSTLFIGAVETAVHTVPYFITNINAMGANRFMSQLPVLVAGIVIFALATWLALRKAAKNFEKVDL